MKADGKRSDSTWPEVSRGRNAGPVAQALCRRLRSLGLEEGSAWHYVDSEDFSAGGGAAPRRTGSGEIWAHWVHWVQGDPFKLLLSQDMFNSLLGAAPFAPLPLLAVLGTAGPIELEAGEAGDMGEKRGEKT